MSGYQGITKPVSSDSDSVSWDRQRPRISGQPHALRAAHAILSGYRRTSRPGSGARTRRPAKASLRWDRPSVIKPALRARRSRTAAGSRVGLEAPLVAGYRQRLAENLATSAVYSVACLDGPGKGEMPVCRAGGLWRVVDPSVKGCMDSKVRGGVVPSLCSASRIQTRSTPMNVVPRLKTVSGAISMLCPFGKGKAAGFTQRQTPSRSRTKQTRN